MRVLVISDSHGAVFDSHMDEMKKYGDFDILVHCGDKYKDAQKFADKLNISTVYQVPGNCDYDISGKEEILFREICGRNVLITHGHLHNVKLNIEALKSYAEENGADAVLYGHTHGAQNDVIGNILYFNPGSTVFPRDGKASFGVMEFTDSEIRGRIILLQN